MNRSRYAVITASIAAPAAGETNGKGRARISHGYGEAETDLDREFDVYSPRPIEAGRACIVQEVGPDWHVVRHDCS